MLVHVAGATGNVSQKIIDSLRRRGHRVRALARDLDKLFPATTAALPTTKLLPSTPGLFDNEKLDVKGISIEVYLKQNPEI
ncbi:hypothetical protein F5B17DRAFT_432700 [Nemania serpens]|nr:hypothetical protein F5B17DRAFT_432700 [Nemania serpens]